MKKFIIAAALIVTTGVLSSYTKESPTKPASIRITLTNVSSQRKDLASAD